MRPCWLIVPSRSMHALPKVVIPQHRSNRAVWVLARLCLLVRSVEAATVGSPLRCRSARQQPCKDARLLLVMWA
jgi:hypothetical protein